MLDRDFCDEAYLAGIDRRNELERNAARRRTVGLRIATALLVAELIVIALVR